jgi:hypothetical protein
MMLVKFSVYKEVDRRARGLVLRTGLVEAILSTGEAEDRYKTGESIGGNKRNIKGRLTMNK